MVQNIVTCLVWEVMAQIDGRYLSVPLQCLRYLQWNDVHKIPTDGNMGNGEHVPLEVRLVSPPATKTVNKLYQVNV
jgi:hypothetical protein